MPNDFTEIQNAELIFTNVLTEKEEVGTGNLIPDQVQTFRTMAYLKKAKPSQYQTGGLEIGTVNLTGYTTEVLPSWCISNQQPIDCFIQRLGKGQFFLDGVVPVAFDQIELDGLTTPINGRFKLIGGKGASIN